jgi:RND family efflux transporter MFP subunit
MPWKPIEVMKKLIATLMLLAALGLAAALGWSSWRQEVVHAVRTMQVDRGPVTAYVRAAGTVRSRRDVPIVSPVPGQVLSVSGREGEPVAAASVLVRLRSDDAQAQASGTEAAVRQVQAEIAQQEEVLQRLQRLVQSGVEPANSVADAQAHLKVDQARLARVRADAQAAQARLSQYVILAPIGGVVSNLDVVPGQYIQAGRTLLSISAAGADDVEILVKFDQADAAQVRVGMPAIIGAGEGRPTFEERVFRIDPVIQRDSGADFLAAWIKVRSAVKLLPNQQVEVSFPVSTRPAAARVPLEALVSQSGADMVWIVTAQGRLHLQPVKLGVYGDRHVEIAAGLEQGQTLAVLEGRALKEGDAVKSSVESAAR